MQHAGFDGIHGILCGGLEQTILYRKKTTKAKWKMTKTKRKKRETNTKRKKKKRKRTSFFAWCQEWERIFGTVSRDWLCSKIAVSFLSLTLWAEMFALALMTTRKAPWLTLVIFFSRTKLRGAFCALSWTKYYWNIDCRSKVPTFSRLSFHRSISLDRAICILGLHFSLPRIPHTLVEIFTLAHVLDFKNRNSWAGRG